MRRYRLKDKHNLNTQKEFPFSNRLEPALTLFNSETQILSSSIRTCMNYQAYKRTPRRIKQSQLKKFLSDKLLHIDP
jgi:hypothetical protein